jgi:hypothetical protein
MGNATSTTQGGSGRGSVDGVAAGAEDELTDSTGCTLEFI